mmetsp:Transcript_18827/g.29157  ORF Transcript_18827/g.29157 Transcript_18827/m.29157 type:complete len:131 (-) Transcript_18827:74-466(-)
MAVLRYKLNCAENVNTEPQKVDRNNSAGKCSGMEHRRFCSSAVMCMSMCINNNYDHEQADVNGGAHDERADINGGAHDQRIDLAVNAKYNMNKLAHCYSANEEEVVVNVCANAHMYIYIAVQMAPRVVPT